MEQANIIIQEWGLDATGLHSKEDILAALSHRITELLSTDPVAFIQLMYRLDIPEGQLDAAMESAAPSALIAHLIWDRQVQKSIMRNSMPQRNTTDENDELSW